MTVTIEMTDLGNIVINANNNVVMVSQDEALRFAEMVFSLVVCEKCMGGEVEIKCKGCGNERPSACGSSDLGIEKDHPSRN